MTLDTLAEKAQSPTSRLRAPRVLEPPHGIAGLRFVDVGFAAQNVVSGDPVLPAGGHAFSMHHAFPTT